ncbi:hypothetical protein LLH00_05100 [bacterium]|nr:hypothetical protein [bacterium]
MAGKSRLSLESIGWLSFYIGVLSIPFFPPYSLVLLLFGGVVATIYHSRNH